MKCDAFFIIGCGRSATTAFAKVLATATNGEVFTEQAPKLLVESRDLIKGTLPEPATFLFQSKSTAIQEAKSRGKVYGDKNPAYLPFIPYALRIWRSKIIFLTRDGRDVVRSSMNWVEYYKANGFAMREDDPSSSRAKPEDDFWDYSRLRPNLGEKYHEEWAGLSRFEKYCWHWANFNSYGLRLLEQENRDNWMLLDVSSTTSRRFQDVFAFLGLEGFDGGRIDAMLESKINSAVEKTGQGLKYPGWNSWTDDQRSIFHRHAGAMMRRLGYDTEAQ